MLDWLKTPRTIGRQDSQVDGLTSTALGVGALGLFALWLLLCIGLVGAADLPGGTATLLIFILALVGLAVEAVAVVLLWRWWRQRTVNRVPKGLATATEAKSQSGEDLARAKARHQRPSMPAQEIEQAPVTEVALYLGDGPGDTPMFATLEDQVVVSGKTGAGKDAFIAVRACLSAPGPLVVTTTRPDIIDVIATPRGEVGKVWVFDPLNVAHWPQRMAWDALAGCQSHETARSRGVSFTAGMPSEGGGNTAFFKRQAAAALQYLMHAAALDDRQQRSMRDVVAWAMNLTNGAQIPQQIIAESANPKAEHLWAELLKAVSNGADDTVASTRVTLQDALDPISSGQVLECLTPGEDRETFDVRAFVQSRDTLVLISDANSTTNVASLTTMLFQEVVDVGKVVASQKPNNRLDPPVRFVGNEICNVAPIEKLPEFFTDARGYGFQTIAFIQAVTQLIDRYGKHRAATLLTQAEYELVLPGMKDEETLDRYSQLVGSVDVAESSISTNADGVRQGTSFSSRTERVLRPEEIRKLPNGKALLLAARGESTIVSLTPWWEGVEGAKLSQQAKRINAHRAVQRERDESEGVAA